MKPGIRELSFNQMTSKKRGRTPRSLNTMIRILGTPRKRCSQFGGTRNPNPYTLNPSRYPNRVPICTPLYPPAPVNPFKGTPILEHPHPSKIEGCVLRGHQDAETPGRKTWCAPLTVSGGFRALGFRVSGFLALGRQGGLGFKWPEGCSW